MIEVVEKPSFKPEDFSPVKKKPGITAILRMRNEQDYLAQAFNSIRPFFDEFVVVYNQCTDRTPELVEQFVRQEPYRTRAFHYVPEVFPQGSERHAALPAHHVCSLVHYSNFAYSKASYRICLVWDGDMIAAPGPLGNIVNRLRSIKPRTLTWWRSPWKHGWWWFSGVNLWDHEGKIFVPKTRPKVSGRRDHGFWPAGRRNVYRHDARFEVLNIRWLLPTFVGFAYFHVKGMKKDRGVGVYQLEKNPRSIFNSLKLDPSRTNSELMTFEEYCRIEPIARTLPNPEDLSIWPIRNQGRLKALGDR
jgi:glycosyltransferase involved in cell wall biosynthesis